MEARRNTAYLGLVINSLGSVHPLLETAGAEGGKEMLTNNSGIQQTQGHDTSNYPDSWHPIFQKCKTMFSWGLGRNPLPLPSYIPSYQMWMLF